MGKILVVGNSLAVTKTIERIRQQDQETQISLLCTESHLPYDRFLLPSLVASAIKETAISPLDQKYFVNHKVDVIANEQIARISLKRKYVTTESKKQIEFDQLMVADFGLLTHLPIKGFQKKGVFNCALLTSIKELIKFLIHVDTAFVSVTNLQGFNMACALYALGKEVVIVSSDEVFLNQILDEETGALLKQIVEGKGIRVVLDNCVEEILGDTEVKAVKLGSGKVIAAQMIVFDSMALDLKFLEGDEGYQLIEDEYFTNNYQNRSWSFGFNVLDGFCFGVTKIPEGGREYLNFDGPSNIFKKIYALGDVLIGTILFNAPADKENLVKVIIQKEPIVGKEEALIGGL